MNSRAAILARLRAKPVAAPASPGAYRPPPPADLADHFAKRATAALATVDRIDGMAALPAAVARYLVEKGLPLTVVVEPTVEGLAWGAAGVAVSGTPSKASTAVSVARAAAGIAETGSIVLTSRDPTGPWANLLADTHVAIVAAGDIAPTFEEAVARLAGNRLPRSLHVATGPSRTGDIEQTLELGAHGAVRLHIVIVP